MGPSSLALCLVVLLLAAALVSSLRAADSGSDIGCANEDCAPIVEVAPLAVAALPAPCPYCGQDPNLWRTQSVVPPPEIDGAAAALVDGSCGKLIYGLNQDEKLPPASLTKIVTAIVAVEQAKLSDQVAITIDGWELVMADGSSIMGLENGMSLHVDDLLYGLLLPSGNDAALALAEYLGGTPRFVDMMNRRVRQAGLANTNFANPDGRNAVNQYSSAFDMALLAREFARNPELRRIAGATSYMPDWGGQILWNSNYFLQLYRGAFGIKIGFTEESNYTMVAGAERNGRELFVAVLGSSDVYTDSARLLDWAFLNTRSTCNDSN